MISLKFDRNSNSSHGMMGKKSRLRTLCGGLEPNIYLFFYFIIAISDLEEFFSTPIRNNKFRRFLFGVLGSQMLTLVGTFYVFFFYYFYYYYYYY